MLTAQSGLFLRRKTPMHHLPMISFGLGHRFDHQRVTTLDPWIAAPFQCVSLRGWPLKGQPPDGVLRKGAPYFVRPKRIKIVGTIDDYTDKRRVAPPGRPPDALQRIGVFAEPRPVWQARSFKSGKSLTPGRAKRGILPLNTGATEDRLNPYKIWMHSRAHRLKAIIRR